MNNFFYNKKIKSFARKNRDQSTKAPDRFKTKISIHSFTSTFSQYLITSLIVIFAAFLFYFTKDFIGYQVVSFALLFVVSIMAIFYGTGPILLASTISALIWNYFFIPPPFTLHIEKTEDTLMFLMFFIIALLNGTLTSRIVRQEKKIRIREERTQALYQLTKELSGGMRIKEVTQIATEVIKKYFKLPVFILLKNEETGNLERQNESVNLTENEMSVATWTFLHALKAGKFTDTLPSVKYTFYPLKGNQMNLGVIAVEHTKEFTQGEEQFWEACIGQISGKYEREYLRMVARNAFILNESDKLYKTLFNSISHELRIPVAAILGASDTLLSQKYSEEIQKKLFNEINMASMRLNRLIENLLNMSRLESERLMLRSDWCDVHDLANKVLESLKQEVQPFEISIIIPEDMPLVHIDFGLMEQVLHNLVLNSTQNAPAGSNIRMKFFYEQNTLTIQVMDRGIGFPASELPSVFNKFYRGKGVKPGGTGLGLSIVKGFVEAHGGSVSAENRKNGGAAFTIKIPVKISEMKNQL